tara:strand:+ start:97 stop:558 length:462 start_codon:yes stop_codon:yes gene_type:complete
MDHIDKKILRNLQDNVTMPLSEIAKNVGISTTPCWSRIKRLEKDGIITSKTVTVDNTKINLPITVFLMISIQSHTDKWLNNFVSVVNKYDQIVEVHRLTGSKVDYQLKILSTSIFEYDKFQQQLIQEIECTNMISSVSLQTIKKFTKIPLDQI